MSATAAPAPSAPAAAAVAGRAARSRLLRFALVGASGVVVNLAALWALAGVLGVRDLVASPIAVEASILWNFVLNDAFTFHDRNAGAQVGWVRRLLRYNAVSLVGLALQLGTFVLVRALVLHVLHREALGVLRYAVQCVGIALATAWNFAGNLHFTWRQAPTAGVAAPPPRAAGEGAA